MSQIHRFVRTFAVMVLAFSFIVSAVSVTSAQDADGVNARIVGRDAFAGNDDLVQQLVHVLIEILDELLNPDDNLENLLPDGCDVTAQGFSCTSASSAAGLFLNASCEASIFGSGYLCAVADVVYSCTAHNIQTPQGATIDMICVAP